METESRINWKWNMNYEKSPEIRRPGKQNLMLHKSPKKSSNDAPALFKITQQRYSVNFPSRQPKSNVVLVFWIKMKKKNFFLSFIFFDVPYDFFQTLHIFCCFVYSVFLTRKSLKTKNYNKAHIKQNGFSVEFFLSYLP